MHNSECKHAHLKIGFIGFGRYGYGVMKAILKSGHHNINNVYYLNINDYLESNANDSDIHKKKVTLLKERLLPRFINSKKYKWDEHYLGLNNFMAKISSDHDDEGVLVISLNKNRGEKVFKKLKGYIKKNTWLFSSISNLKSSSIKDLLGDKCMVLRYLPNMGTKVGQGITAVYVDVEPRHRKEGEVVFKKVFQGLGNIYFVDTEEQIIAARVITGSTIGVIAYLAQSIADAIGDLNIKGLGDEKEIAAEIVYHSMAGALALGKDKEISTWGNIYDSIRIKPGPDEKPGTTDIIIKKMRDGKVPEVIKDSFRLSFEKCKKGETEE